VEAGAGRGGDHAPANGVSARPDMEAPELVFIEARSIPLTLLQVRKGGLLAQRSGNVKTTCPSWL
jgi:hypothetical protein